ncbi:MAG: hypothetical protein OSJ62_05120 [Lachnospiraceae bacterium]|nr:hypothetical protein [Lachnospiraceae bacterium]
MENTRKKEKKKIAKGEYGYLTMRKKRLGTATALCLCMVAVFFFTGYLTTKTRNNIFTVMAILSALPTAKFAASFLALLPYPSASSEQYQSVLEHAKQVRILTDLVITTGEKTLPTLFVAVHNSSVCGYTEAEKYDTAYAETFLTQNLMTNGQKATVKIFKDKKVFFNRLDTMRQIETEEKQQKKDQRIAEILLTLIM